jgi:hypothetical protein
MSDIEQLEAEYKDACWAYVVACARYDKAYKAAVIEGGGG